jgi:D-alanine-D-alanine ligase
MPIRVLVVYGGPSPEHEVSVQSAQSVLKALPKDRYEARGLCVDREGDARPLAEALGLGVHKPWPDVVFPLIHGPYGEDGTLQGLLEWAGLPYVGSAITGSAVCMDKAVMKSVFARSGLPTVRWELVRRQDLADPRAILDLAEELGYPVFVKPARQGSSVGVSKVHGPQELLPALGHAAYYDDRLLVEEGVEGRELECAVLGDGRAQASVVGEVHPSREFYDYTAKYTPGSRLDIPASLEEGVAAQVRELALLAFEACDCRDLARVDFFLSRDGRVLLNEVNTLPGFTAFSMYPRLWEASGLPYPELLSRLVELALARGPRPRRV